jgi:hypothetical protein
LRIGDYNAERRDVEKLQARDGEFYKLHKLYLCHGVEVNGAEFSVGFQVSVYTTWLCKLPEVQCQNEMQR